MITVGTSARSAATARLTARVVLPAPPFYEMIARMSKTVPPSPPTLCHFTTLSLEHICAGCIVGMCTLAQRGQ